MNLIFNIVTPLSAIYKSVSEAARHRKIDNVFWTVKQSAKVLGVDYATVLGWIRKGKHFDPATVVRIGNNVRIPQSEVERVLKGRVDQYIGKSVLLQS
jgi:excisionase family DNA binding protein